MVPALIEHLTTLLGWTLLRYVDTRMQYGISNVGRCWTKVGLEPNFQQGNQTVVTFLPKNVGWCWIKMLRPYDQDLSSSTTTPFWATRAYIACMIEVFSTRTHMTQTLSAAIGIDTSCNVYESTLLELKLKHHMFCNKASSLLLQRSTTTGYIFKPSRQKNWVLHVGKNIIHFYEISKILRALWLAQNHLP